MQLCNFMADDNFWVLQVLEKNPYVITEHSYGVDQEWCVQLYNFKADNIFTCSKQVYDLSVFWTSWVTKLPV